MVREMPESRHIVCPHCTAVNRVPGEKSAAPAKCGKCHRPLFTGHPLAATAASFAKQIEANDIPVVVDFWAEWCGPCKAIAPTLEEVAKEYSGKLKVAKVNVDENQEIPRKYGIRGIPTLMLFKNGNIEATKVGALSKSQLTAFLDSNI